MLRANLAKFLAFWLRKSISMLGCHFHRLGLILSSIEALIFCFNFFLSGRFSLIGAGQVNVEICNTDLLPSGLLLRCLTLIGSYHLDAWRSKGQTLVRQRNLRLCLPVSLL